MTFVTSRDRLPATTSIQGSKESLGLSYSRQMNVKNETTNQPTNRTKTNERMTSNEFITSAFLISVRPKIAKLSRGNSFENLVENTKIGKFPKCKQFKWKFREKNRMERKFLVTKRNLQKCCYPGVIHREVVLFFGNSWKWCSICR